MDSPLARIMTACHNLTVFDKMGSIFFIRQGRRRLNVHASTTLIPLEARFFKGNGLFHETPKNYQTTLKTGDKPPPPDKTHSQTFTNDNDFV